RTHHAYGTAVDHVDTARLSGGAPDARQWASTRRVDLRRRGGAADALERVLRCIPGHVARLRLTPAAGWQTMADDSPRGRSACGRRSTGSRSSRDLRASLPPCA